MIEKDKEQCINSILKEIDLDKVFEIFIAQIGYLWDGATVSDAIFRTAEEVRLSQFNTVYQEYSDFDEVEDQLEKLEVSCRFQIYNHLPYFISLFLHNYLDQNCDLNNVQTNEMYQYIDDYSRMVRGSDSFEELIRMIKRELEAYENKN